MRSIRLLAGATAALILGSACGGDGGGTPPPDNRAPVAGFTQVCTELSCVFTDASTDPDGNTTITARSWSFGDGTPVSTEASPTHVYAVAGTFTVVLTVTDNGGLMNSLSRPVVVTVTPPPPPGNTAPTASFTSACTGNTCTFTSTSTDADGTIASYAWNFGETASATNTSTEANPVHTYAAVTQQTAFTVTLTVTDDDGTPSAAATGTVTIQPPVASRCTTSGTMVTCFLDITARATVKITLAGVECEIGAQRVFIPAPIGPKQVFGNVCSRTVGEEYPILDSQGAPRVFEAGTRIPIRFDQGAVDPGDPIPLPPQANLEGSFANWTIEIDDGGNPTAPGEPDFTDVILSVQATPAP